MLGGELLKEATQQLGTDHRLRLREAAQAHRMGANLALHAAQLAGGAEPAQGIGHRIQEAKKQPAQIIALAQLPARIGKSAMRRKARRLDPLPELLQKLPAAEIALGERRFSGGFGGHAAMKPVRVPSYQ